MKQGYIPIWEYAAKYGKPPQTIYRWIREGKIPKNKIKVIQKTVERKIILDQEPNKIII